MKALQTLAGALAIALALAATGCATQTPPVTGAASERAASSANVPPEQAFAGGRQLLFEGQPISFDTLVKNLPERIPASDADKLLVKIDPAQIAETGAKQVQQLYGLYNRGWYSPFHSLYSSYLYYPYGSYYMPYYYNAGAYYPYYSNYGYSAYTYPYTSTSLYYPFFYRYAGLYHPYYYRWLY